MRKKERGITMNLSQEQKKKAALAASPQELLDLARAEEISMTREEAEEYFRRLHPPVGELADEELESVAGGGCGYDPSSFVPEVKQGDSVRSKSSASIFSSHNAQCSGRMFTALGNSYSYVYPGTGSRSERVNLKCQTCGKVIQLVAVYDLEKTDG